MKTIPLAFSLLFLIISRAAAQEPLYDTDGDQVVAGAEYYMVQAANNAQGGGINLIPGRKCPLDVYLLNWNTYHGRSLSFYPARNTSNVITTSSDVNIKINLESNHRCPNHLPVWKVDDYDADIGQWFITTGGVIGDPGARTLMNWFKFERDFDAYRIVHCPSVCFLCLNLCLNVGFIGHLFRFQLALLPFEYFYPRFHFIKVSSVSTLKM